MPSFQLTPEVLSMIAGIFLSLLFSYVPGLNTKFAAWPGELKRATMLGLLLLTSVVIFSLGCSGILNAGLTCDKQGIIQLLWSFILAVIANQSVFSISPQTQAVQQAKFKS